MTYKRPAFFLLLQGAWRSGFRYIYKPGNPYRTRERAYLFHIFLTTTRNINEIKRSILLVMIICEIQLFILIQSTKAGIGAGSQVTHRYVEFGLGIGKKPGVFCYNREVCAETGCWKLNAETTRRNI